MATAAIPVATKLEVAKAVTAEASAPPLLGSLVMILVTNGHFDLLPDVAHGFRRVVDERLGITRAEVRFARAADDAAEREVAEALAKVVGGKVAINATVDPSLVGGFVARVGDHVYDGSLTRQLAKLRSTLLKS